MSMGESGHLAHHKVEMVSPGGGIGLGSGHGPKQSTTYNFASVPASGSAPRHSPRGSAAGAAGAAAAGERSPMHGGGGHGPSLGNPKNSNIRPHAHTHRNSTMTIPAHLHPAGAGVLTSADVNNNTGINRSRSASRKSAAMNRPHGSFRGSWHYQANNNSLFVKNAEMYAIQDVEGSQYIINPQSLFREVWDFVVALFVLFLCWAEPYLVAFPSPAFETHAAHDFGYFIDALFYADIILNFRTGFIHNSEIVMDPKEIAKHYLSGWFWVDAVGTFEWEEVLEGINHSQRASIKISKLFKLAKLLRMGRIIRWLRTFFKFRHFFLWMFMFVFGTHWVACIWFVIETFVDSTRYHMVELGQIGAGQLYWDVLDQVFLHMHGVTAAPRFSMFHDFYSIFARFVGFAFEVSLGALVVPLIMLWAGSHTKFRQHVEAVDEAMEELNIPEHLRQRVNKYYDYLWLNKKYDSAGETFYGDPLLSHSLKKEISREIARVVIPWKSFKYSADIPEGALAAMVMAMNLHIFMPNDVVFHKGDHGREMYYVVKGTVEFHFNPEQSMAPANLRVAEPGQFFGEMALLSDDLRSATVRAVAFVELMVLTKEDLFDMLHDYPVLSRMLLRIAAEHLPSSGTKDVEERLKPFLLMVRAQRLAERKAERDGQHHLIATSPHGAAPPAAASAGAAVSVTVAPVPGANTVTAIDLPAPSAPPANISIDFKRADLIAPPSLLSGLPPIPDTEPDTDRSSLSLPNMPTISSPIRDRASTTSTVSAMPPLQPTPHTAAFAVTPSGGSLMAALGNTASNAALMSATAAAATDSATATATASASESATATATATAAAPTAAAAAPGHASTISASNITLSAPETRMQLLAPPPSIIIPPPTSGGAISVLAPPPTIQPIPSTLSMFPHSSPHTSSGHAHAHPPSMEARLSRIEHQLETLLELFKAKSQSDHDRQEVLRRRHRKYI